MAEPNREHGRYWKSWSTRFHPHPHGRLQSENTDCHVRKRALQHSATFRFELDHLKKSAVYDTESGIRREWRFINGRHDKGNQITVHVMNVLPELLHAGTARRCRYAKCKHHFVSTPANKAVQTWGGQRYAAAAIIKLHDLQHISGANCAPRVCKEEANNILVLFEFVFLRGGKPFANAVM